MKVLTAEECERIEKLLDAGMTAATRRASIRSLLTTVAALRSDIQCMVDKAASESLDGYRELGSRAAAAENERDALRMEIAALRAEVARFTECVEWYSNRTAYMEGTVGLREVAPNEASPDVLKDCGDRARACLDAMKEKTDG